MQNMNDNSIDIYRDISEGGISELFFPLVAGERIFFTWDLGSGKSTFIRAFLRRHFHDPSLIVRSPTYIYYQKYGENIYHFDLYRLESLADFSLIGGEDILADPDNICLIEWPEILDQSIMPTRSIHIVREENESRTITLTHYRARATEWILYTP